MLKIIIILACIYLVSSSIVNLEAVTFIEIESHLVKAQHKIVFTNVNMSLPIKRYVYTDSMKNVVTGFYDAFNNKLHYEEICDKNSLSDHTFMVTLNEPLHRRQQSILICKFIIVDKIKPLSKSRYEHEPQLVNYKENILFQSAYPTVKYKLYLTFPNGSGEVDADKPPNSVKNTILHYNFHNLSPYAFEEKRFVYYYDKPMFVINSLKRLIHVSLFGMVFVQDNVIIENRASKLLGNYRKSVFGAGLPHWFHTHLPASAQDIKFYDVLGNNSDSQVLYYHDYVTLKYKSRYPLSGGWKYEYTIEYNLPIYECMYELPGADTYFLQMRAIDHVLSDTFIEKAEVRIILPEFSSILKTTVPKGLTRSGDEVTYSSLNALGNPTVVLQGSYLVEDHIAAFMVQFTHNKTLTFMPIVLIVIYTQSIFVVYLIWNNCNN